MIAVIIPVHNKYHLTEDCLKSLAEHTPLPLDVIIVDNASSDETPSACPALGKELFQENFLFLRQETNQNFAGACNIGARAAKERKRDLLFFLNNDTLLTAGWLPPLLDALNSPPHPSVVAPLLLYPEFAGRKDRVQHIGLAFEPHFFPKHLYEGFPADHPVCKKRRSWQALTGAALLLSTETFLNEGLFDEDFINGGEDVALGIRLSSKGHLLINVPESRIYHLASQTPGIHDHALHNAKTFKRKTLHLIKPDLSFIVKKDGYELALTSSLQIYLDLPPRRKELADKRLAQAKSVEQLEECIEREPLCHNAYPILAEKYSLMGEDSKAAATWFLANKFRPSKETAKHLLHTAKLSQDKKFIQLAENTLKCYAKKKFSHLYDAALFMADFTQRIGHDKVHALYSDWLTHSKDMKKYFTTE